MVGREQRRGMARPVGSFLIICRGSEVSSASCAGPAAVDRRFRDIGSRSDLRPAYGCFPGALSVEGGLIRIFSDLMRKRSPQ